MEAKDYVLALINAGLTQAQIHEKSGVPQSTVSKIARGEVGDVYSKTYRSLQTLHSEVCGYAVRSAPPSPSVEQGAAHMWPELAQAQQPLAPEALKTVALHLLPKNGQPVDENMQLVERRTGLPTRRLAQQPFTGPDQRVGPACRRGYVLPEVAAVLPAGI